MNDIKSKLINLYKYQTNEEVEKLILILKGRFENEKTGITDR